MSRELSIEVNLTPTQIIDAVMRMKKEERTSLLKIFCSTVRNILKA